MRVILYLITSAFLISSCKTTAKSDLKHDAENPVASTSPYFYHFQSEDDFIRDSLGRYFGVTNKDYILDSKHPIVMRLQSWSNKIVGIMKERYPDTLTNIPDPIIKVAVSDTNNAYATPMPLCFENVFYSPIAPVVRPETPCLQSVYLSAKSLKPSEEGEITKEKASFAQLSAFINNQNNSEAPCKVQIVKLDQDNFALKAGKGCTAPKQDLVSNLVVYPYTPYITLFTGGLDDSEEVNVATLYHELGHYYHAHGTVDRNVDFAYKLADWNEAAAPQQSIEFAAIRQDYLDTKDKLDEATLNLKSMLNLTPKSIYKKVSGQKVSGVLTNFIVESVRSNAKLSCENSGSSDICKQCLDAKNTADLSSFLNFNPIGFVGDEDLAVTDEYLKFETKAMNCLKNIPIVITLEKDSTVFNRSLNGFLIVFDWTVSALESPEISDYHEGSWWDYIREASDSFRDRDESQYTRYLSNKVAISAFTNKYLDAKNELKAINDKFISEKLGFYSTEQEADDLSAEWLHLAGFSGSTMGDNAMNMIRNKEVAKKCSDLRAANWKDSQGTPVVIPWGPLDNEHPESCFRARNADLEAIAHGYGPVAKSPAADLTPRWEDLVKELPTVKSVAEKQTLSTTAFSLRKQAQLRSKRPRHSLSCRYSQTALNAR